MFKEANRAPTDLFRGAKGVGWNNQQHIKNHNWAAIMWAEEKVPLYHKIFASNETVPGQPPEEQVSVYFNRDTSKYLVDFLKSPRRFCSKQISKVRSCCHWKIRTKGLGEKKSENTVIKITNAYISFSQRMGYILIPSILRTNTMLVVTLS